MAYHPLSPGMAIRLTDYLQTHPETSVFWRSDSRTWVFSDDDELTDVTEVSESDLARYLDSQAQGS